MTIGALLFRSLRVSRHLLFRLSDDEVVVALDPAVRGEDEEAEPDSEDRAVLGDRLPVELDDVIESIGVVAPPEAEPFRADPVLVGAGRASLDLLVSLCLEDRRQGEPGLRRDRADLLRRLEDVPPVLRPELRDEISTKACGSVIGYLLDRLVASPSTVPEQGPRVDYLSCNAGGSDAPLT